MHLFYVLVFIGMVIDDAALVTCLLYGLLHRHFHHYMQYRGKSPLRDAPETQRRENHREKKK